MSGSVAMSVYTLPRATRDIDFVVHLQLKDIELLVTTFSAKYYCDADAVKEAITKKSLFNIIDAVSGFKADFVILKNEEYRQTEFKRKRQILFEDIPIYIVSPEDLLISKLIWIQDFQSGIQMDDIVHLWETDALDKHYILKWVHSLKLNTFNLLYE